MPVPAPAPGPADAESELSYAAGPTDVPLLEVEQFLHTHLHVADVQVVGVPTRGTARSRARRCASARTRRR